MGEFREFTDQKIFILQEDFAVGAVEENCNALLKAAERARDKGASLLVAGELALVGYPPRDLLLRSAFIRAAEKAVERIAAETACPLLFGAPIKNGDKLYNGAVLAADKKARVVARKSILPNYGVFDERRFFTPAELSRPIRINPKTSPGETEEPKTGVLICEDIWRPGPAAALKKMGAEQLIVLNGSPFETGKPAARLAKARERVKECGLPLLYVNLFGAQDEAVFDGRSFALDHEGELLYQAPAFAPALTEVIANHPPSPPKGFNPKEVYSALVLGLRLYMAKTGFSRCLLGLSGGVDSALTAAVAADAAKSENVKALIMPSPYSGHTELAIATAEAIGVKAEIIPIKTLMETFDRSLKKTLAGVAAENIQARIRAVLLMARSNSEGSLLLSTGNKSESAVGYSTLYGDMCGGFSLLKDIYKTRVYELARWRNGHCLEDFANPRLNLISEETLNLPPSAELRPNQLDQDTLPPYDKLDKMLHLLLEQNLDPEDTPDPKFAAECLQMILKSEYKRQQAAPGVKVSSCLFGWDRRYPIANHFIPSALKGKGR